MKSQPVVRTWVASVLLLILSNFAAGTKGPRTFDVNSLSDRELGVRSGVR